MYGSVKTEKFEAATGCKTCGVQDFLYSDVSDGRKLREGVTGDSNEDFKTGTISIYTKRFLFTTLSHEQGIIICVNRILS